MVRVYYESARFCQFAVKTRHENKVDVSALRADVVVLLRLTARLTTRHSTGTRNT